MSSLKPVSSAGHACEVCFGVVLIVACSVVVSTTWWVVYFWDCPSIDDDSSVALYMVLKQGFCMDPEQGQQNNFEDCQQWRDVKDQADDEDIRDGAQAYIDARNLGNAAMAFSVAFCVVSLLALIPALRKWNLLRYISAILAILVCFMFVGALGAASNTWFTDSSNYPYLHEFCGSEASFPYSGFGGAVVGMGMPGSVVGKVALTLICPCCCCADTPETASMLQEPIHQQNPVVAHAAPAQATPVSVVAAPATESSRQSGSTISYASN